MGSPASAETRMDWGESFASAAFCSTVAGASMRSYAESPNSCASADVDFAGVLADACGHLGGQQSRR